MIFQFFFYVFLVIFLGEKPIVLKTYCIAQRMGNNLQ